ncbi:hypothetical protein IQ254_14785 [Nodosilinea sp. LEGE 07088]|uniref:hypothetical protein n=1 Tax=Nodosilinea sp. LEGE 07088 TaxID=2777968 RepID=UPI001880D6EA|nr:hypothetical protein [Nodosilinea sp. LEGE 07088]MBE9138439.1 hypothetical protein [Nodosilinea sp. LEGE 07088]
MQSYYPWNTEAFVSWLRQELTHHDKQSLAAILRVPRHVLRAWLTEPIPSLTLAHLRAIASYKAWNLNQVTEWLGLQPAHVQELMDQAVAETRISLR